MKADDKASQPVAMAVAAHPDDIEFAMAGTLLHLAEDGYRLHYMTVANGSCGTTAMSRDQIVKVRTAESRAAAAVLRAVYHEPLVDDIQVYYTPLLVARLAAVVRQVAPVVLLVPALQDYMEDHTATARAAVTAAFTRNMPNFVTEPPTKAVFNDIALYHAMPAGLTDQLRNPARAELYVDVTAVMNRKREALACHRSQKEWLDRSQGQDSYMTAMEDMAARVGQMSGRFEFAEGWHRHSHLGFGPEDYDPLSDTLGDRVVFSRGEGNP